MCCPPAELTDTALGGFFVSTERFWRNTRKEFDLASTLLEKSLHLRRKLTDRWGIAATLGSLAWTALGRNELGRATNLLEKSLLIRLEIGDKGGMAWCLEKMAKIAHLKSDPTRAVHIFSAAAALRASVNSIIDPSDQDDYQSLIDSLRNELGTDAFQAVWSEGQGMELDRAIRYVFPSTGT